MAVLVGIDLRANGQSWLVGRAARYAVSLGSTVDLVFLRGQQPEQPEHRERLEALLSELPSERRGRARVEAMDPAEGLIELSHEYELLVVGTREPPALERLIRGPMATRVLRTAACPVLLPRGEHGPGERPRLLVGVDVNGPHPERLLALAAPWAVALDGALDALWADAAGLPSIADRSVRAAAEREWRAGLGPQRERLEALLAAVPEPNRGIAVLAAGNPEDVLTARSADYALTFVGNRDRVGLSRLLLGAVGDLVARRAVSDVISLPTNTQA